MREKLQTLPLTQLRELAKAQGLKGVTTLKKAEIIDRLCEIAGGKAADKDLAGMDAAGAEGGGVHNIIPSEPLAAAEEKKTAAEAAISIHSPIAETDSKYTYIFHILLIFFIKLYHIPLLYTSHPPIDSHFHQNINYITWCKSLTVFMCTWHPHQSNIGSKSKAIYKNL